MASVIPLVQVLSITSALVGSGGIAALTVFDIPELQAQPASRSLPSIRWLFSRGSHIFPTAAILSSAGFGFIAGNILSQNDRAGLLTFLKTASPARSKVIGYALASLLALSIAPVTQFLMIPTNFRLIELNDKLGGSRSAQSNASREEEARDRPAEESVDGKGETSQFKDISGPQTATTKPSSKEQDKEAQRLLKTFGQLNLLRAILLGAGGVVGLTTALI